MRGVVGAQQGVLLLQLLQQPALRAPKHRAGVRAWLAAGLSATRMDVTGSWQQRCHRRPSSDRMQPPVRSGQATQLKWLVTWNEMSEWKEEKMSLKSWSLSSRPSAPLPSDAAFSGS